MMQTLGFVGGGNMARALIGGLIARGAAAARIVVADPGPAQRNALRADYGVRVTDDNSLAARDADVVVFAVKPQELQRAASALRPALQARQPLVISVAAGVRIEPLQRWTGRDAVVRCMPNRPALQGCGVTGMFASAEVDAAQRRIAQDILSAVGKTLWLEREADLDAVTAVSGSGPAYFFLLIEMLEETGVALGLSPDVSRTLAVETAFGSGVMAHEAGADPATLRAQVTSKGGTTDAALRHLEAQDVRRIFREAVAAAAARAAELAQEYGK
jgi:pyrroline-5-carboxylate reductase